MTRQSAGRRIEKMFPNRTRSGSRFKNVTGEDYFNLSPSTIAALTSRHEISFVSAMGDWKDASGPDRLVPAVSGSYHQWMSSLTTEAIKATLRRRTDSSVDIEAIMRGHVFMPGDRSAGSPASGDGTGTTHITRSPARHNIGEDPLLSLDGTLGHTIKDRKTEGAETWRNSMGNVQRQYPGRVGPSRQQDHFQFDNSSLVHIITPDALPAAPKSQDSRLSKIFKGMNHSTLFSRGELNPFSRSGGLPDLCLDEDINGCSDSEDDGEAENFPPEIGSSLRSIPTMTTNEESIDPDMPMSILHIRFTDVGRTVLRQIGRTFPFPSLKDLNPGENKLSRSTRSHQSEYTEDNSFPNEYMTGGASAKSGQLRPVMEGSSTTNDDSHTAVSSALTTSRFSCLICNRAYMWNTSLSRHIKNRHPTTKGHGADRGIPPSPDPTASLSVQTGAASDNVADTEKHPSTAIFPCPHCDKTFRCRWSVPRHVATKHPNTQKKHTLPKVNNDKRLEAAVGEEQNFSNSTDIHLETRATSSSTRHSNTNESAMVVPMRDERTFFCGCGKGFTTAQSLRIHIALPCLMASAPPPDIPASGSISVTSKPVDNVDPPTEGTIVVSNQLGRAGKIFARSSDTKTDTRRQITKSLPHRCTDCGIAFEKKAGLIQHARVHKKRKAVDCVCGSRFFNARSYEGHIDGCATYQESIKEK